MKCDGVTLNDIVSFKSSFMDAQLAKYSLVLHENIIFVCGIVLR